MKIKDNSELYIGDFRHSLENTVFDVLEAANFYFAEDFCEFDDNIVEIVRHELLNDYSFRKNWADFARKMTTNEFRGVLEDVIEKMRQKRPSKAQLKFFLTMKYETDDEMVPDDDYLVFCHQIERLKSKSFHFGLASDAQVQTYAKVAEKQGIEIDCKLPWTKIQVKNGLMMLKEK
ncbi:hypothetical protein [Bacillus timonensis]|uniref:hypothetical protein n=1 Tax=Bacillus timonensis TaxID=1033734 RepID=UPI0002892868|nr:hypothetical protein [Bacillus timonensis]